jgi:hypothetical protein
MFKLYRRNFCFNYSPLFPTPNALKTPYRLVAPLSVKNESKNELFIPA